MCVTVHVVVRDFAVKHHVQNVIVKITINWPKTRKRYEVKKFSLRFSKVEYFIVKKHYKTSCDFFHPVSKIFNWELQVTVVTQKYLHRHRERVSAPVVAFFLQVKIVKKIFRNKIIVFIYTEVTKFIDLNIWIMILR